MIRAITDKLYRELKGQPAHQIGGKDKCPVKDAQRQRIGTMVKTRTDLACEARHSLFQLVVGIEALEG